MTKWRYDEEHNIHWLEIGRWIGQYSQESPSHLWAERPNADGTGIRREAWNPALRLPINVREWIEDRLKDLHRRDREMENERDAELNAKRHAAMMADLFPSDSS
jgi:hypothetical protein